MSNFPPQRPQRPGSESKLDAEASFEAAAAQPETASKTPAADGSILPARPSLPVRPSMPGTRTRQLEVADSYTATEAEQGVTFEDVLNKSYDQSYKYLEDDVVEYRTWLQEYLQEKNLEEEVGAARAERGEKYADMQKRLQSLVLRQLLSQATRRYENRNVNEDEKDDNYKIATLVTNEILGLGPLEPLWVEPGVTEIIVNGPDHVRIERNGKLVDVPGVKFRNRDHAMDVAQQILLPLGRTVDVRVPFANGRLPDGSRVHILHYAVAPGGPMITVRRFPEKPFSIRALLYPEPGRSASMSEEMGLELANLVSKGCSIVVSGGTGSGKQLSLDTPLPTPTGMTTMGDVRLGDMVLDENGKPTTVIGYHPQPLKDCYELVFSDGTKIVAGAEHNWYTHTRSARRAVSRQETSPKMLNAERFGSDETVAALTLLYAERQETISAAKIIKAAPQMKNVVHNTTRTLTPILGHGRSSRYDAKVLLQAALDRALAVTYDQRQRSATGSVVTTKQIFESLRTSTGHANHSVQLLSAPVAYAEQELLVSPYLFGAWLGDGYTMQGMICGVDEEIFQIASNKSERTSTDTFDTHPSRNIPLRQRRFENLSSDLRKLGLIGTAKSPVQKFIPEQYLYSSEEQRRALIAGMLDTDGSVGKQGEVHFHNSNKTLIEGFRQIVHSLGYQSTVTSKAPTYVHDGKKKGQTAYTATFYTADDVFKLTRKAEAHREARKTMQGHLREWRYIVECNPVESVPTACITVDSSNSLYLASESFIPTHNTSLLNALSGAISRGESIITIEDNIEMQLHPDADRRALETRASRSDEAAAVTIRDLVREALRMRPDRIIVGEVRDSSAYDMLQAMTTGHDGSMTTVHANDAEGAVERMVGLVQQSGEADTTRAMSMIASGVDLIVVVDRFPEDGSRRVVEIAEVPPFITRGVAGASDKLDLRPIWEFEQSGLEVDESGEERVTGTWVKRNELSESFVRRNRIDKKHTMTLEEALAVSDTSE